MTAKYKKFLIPLLTWMISHQACPQPEVKQLKIGNFALPSSQQPGALFGIGQNVLNKGVCQPGSIIIQEKGAHKNFIDLAPSLLYGVTDSLSLLFITPISLYHQPKDGVHTGFQNIITQLEYAFYKKERLKYTDCATLVGNIIFPTRSLDKNNPIISSGPPSSLLGVTLSHTSIDWYYFASTAVLFPISNQRTKIGNKYFFQCGIGRNIPSSPKLIALWIIELNVILSDSDKIQGAYNFNSGGQVFYLGPTLWLSTKNFFIQGGIGLPIYQLLKGNQKTNQYLAALNLGITI